MEAAGEIAGVAFDLIKTASGGLDFVCGGGAVLFGALAEAGEKYGSSLDTTVETALTTADYLGAFHVIFGFMILWIVGMGMIYYAICHRIISKKLNLE